MSSAPENKEPSSLKELVEELIADWDAQVKEFRRLSLDTNDPSERSRMRAKADTKHYSRQELIRVLEEAEENEAMKTSNDTWPGLSGILSSGR